MTAGARIDGHYVYVDWADRHFLYDRRWKVVEPSEGLFYLHCYKNSRHVFIHRLIMNAQDGQLVDHKDGNGLNNRRSNLRFCTHVENGRNARVPKGTIELKGVKRAETAGKFIAKITLSPGDQKYLGTFGTALEAALAYDAAAAEHFGEFAATNAALGLLPTETHNPTKEDGEREIGNLRTPEQTESRQGSGTIVKSPLLSPSADLS